MLSWKHFTSSSNSEKVCGVGALIKYASPDITSCEMKRESLSTLMMSLLWNVPAAGSYSGISVPAVWQYCESKRSSSFILCNLCLCDLLCTWWFLPSADCRRLWCNTWCQRTHLSTPPKQATITAEIREFPAAMERIICGTAQVSDYTETCYGQHSYLLVGCLYWLSFTPLVEGKAVYHYVHFLQLEFISYLYE